MFTPGAPDPVNANLQQSLLSAWNAWYSGAGQTYDWNSVVVLTDNLTRNGIYGRQEFITTTPEPATLMLLGTGLVFVLGIAIKRGGLA